MTLGLPKGAGGLFTNLQDTESALNNEFKNSQFPMNKVSVVPRDVSQHIVNTTCFMRNSFLLSLAALTVVFSGLSAQAKTVKSPTARTSARVNHQSLGSPATKTQSHSATTPTQVASSVTVESAATPIPGTALTSASALKAQTSTTVAPVVAQADGTMPGTTTPGTTTPGTTTPDTTTPSQTTPGTTTPDTTPSQTTPGTTTPDTTPTSPTTPGTTTPGITPTSPTTPGTTTPGPNEVVPGRATRSGPSYIGIGGNFGLTGDTALGNDSHFTVISKIGLTRNFSVRPAAVIGTNTTFLIPITLDFPFKAAGNSGFSIAPYVGAGAALATGGSNTARLLLTGGVDVPLTAGFTATAAVNAAVINRTDVGILLGVGYTFPGGF